MSRQTGEADLPLAVVMGLSPTGLHVVRSLGRAGVRVIGVSDGLQPGRASRYLKGVITNSDPMQRLDAICALSPYLDENASRKPVLIPTSDQDVEFVIAHAGRLARHFAFQDSYQNGVAASIMDKGTFYALCEAHGVVYPKLWAATRDELSQLARELPYPVLIKPARIHVVKDRMQGKKCWLVTCEAELSACVSQIPIDAGMLLIQEVIHGPESEITLVAVHVDGEGRQHQTFTARKLRQYPPGFGSASMAQSASERGSAEILSDFLAVLGYHGVAAAEFKRRPSDGKLVMIEINVRPSLWFSLTQAAGRPVVLSAYRELAGLPLDLPDVPQVEGVRWTYAPKDIWSSLFYRTTSAFILPQPDLQAVGKAHSSDHAVFNWDDPGPAVVEWLNFALKGFERIAMRFGFRHKVPAK